jgi:hypothetical protein
VTEENAREGGRDEDDRVVSRRVDNPTAAGPGDEAAYRAADPVPDGSGGADPADDTTADDRQAGGGSAERARAEMQNVDESEPTRSE